MTILLLLLGSVIGVGTGLAVLLWRLSRTGPVDELAARDFQRLAPTGSALDSFEPMCRLFLEEDFSFLASQAGRGPGTARKLRRERRQVLRLYLRELRAEFRGVYKLCRLLAPTSQDPNFAASITRMALSFNSLFALVQLRCALGWFLPVSLETADLVAAFDSLRQAASTAWPVLPPQPAVAGARARW